MQLCRCENGFVKNLLGQHKRITMLLPLGLVADVCQRFCINMRERDLVYSWLWFRQLSAYVLYASVIPCLLVVFCMRFIFGQFHFSRVSFYVGLCCPAKIIAVKKLTLEKFCPQKLHINGTLLGCCLAQLTSFYDLFTLFPFTVNQKLELLFDFCR